MKINSRVTKDIFGNNGQAKLLLLDDSPPFED